MVDSLNDTQPIQVDTLPYVDSVDDNDDGPGCLLWTVVFGFGLVVAIGVFGLSFFNGWNSGLQTAQINATATRGQYVLNQCDNLGRGLTIGETANLIERRFIELEEENTVPGCVAEYAPRATSLALTNAEIARAEEVTPSPQLTAQVTEAVVASPTEELNTKTPLVIQQPTEATEIVIAPQAAPEITYDLDGLLSEARGFIQNSQWDDAIDNLDAIMAVDANYQATLVEELMFQALTSAAERSYRSCEPAQAVLLTDRAEAFGDIGELNYERFIANTYLRAQTNANFNYIEAIQALRTIIYEQGLTNYCQNGEAFTMLFNQYAAYGDALGFQNNHCGAVQQYNAALQMRQDGTVSAKANQSQIYCNQPQPIVPGGAPPPVATYAPVGVGN